MKTKKKDNKLTINHTPVFKRNLEAYKIGFRYIVNQGGSRSGKTYAICQLLLVLALQDKLIISIVRKSLPSLKSSVMRDFIDLLKEYELYDESAHNKTDNYYTLRNGSVIEFYGVDDEQKIRGRKRDLLFMNEANEFSYEDFNQLMLRTSGAVFIDFNPSDTEHWLYALLDKEEKSTLIKSTYKDNPFLKQEQIDYIEGLINTDENYYKIYALGERPISNARIYTHFKKYIQSPEQIEKSIFGLDFGYNHHTALIRCDYALNAVYVQEIIYEAKLTTDALIERLNTCNVGNEIIYCDYSRPEIIESLRLAGYNAKAAQKQVLDGINTVKQTQIYIHEDSVNLWNESKQYSWRTDKDGKILDEPIKEHDDLLDSLRYALYSGKRNNSGVFSTEWTFIN